MCWNAQLKVHLVEYVTELSPRPQNPFKRLPQNVQGNWETGQGREGKKTQKAKPGKLQNDSDYPSV